MMRTMGTLLWRMTRGWPGTMKCVDFNAPVMGGGGRSNGLADLGGAEFELWCNHGMTWWGYG